MKNTYKVMLISLAVLGVVGITVISTGEATQFSEVHDSSGVVGIVSKMHDLSGASFIRGFICVASSVWSDFQEKITPEKITPEKITPEKITPEKITPEKITPEKITPEKITPEKITKDVKYEYELVDICKFPVSMEVGYFVQVEKCGDYKIKLEQVPCGDIGRNATTDFPCYEGCVTIKVRANYPAIFSASVNKWQSSGDVDILNNKMHLYWENGVNTIQGGTGWEELKLYLEAWDFEIWKFTAGTVKVGEIAIKVKPKDTQLED